MYTPNIASVAQRGTTFLRAYTQAPQCCPTRNSFMTSRRPDRTRVFTNGELANGGPQDALPCPTPMPVAPTPTTPCKKWTNAPPNGSMVYFRAALGPAGQAVITLPQWFKMHGYHTSGGGKTFHVRLRCAFVYVHARSQ